MTNEEWEKTYLKFVRIVANPRKLSKALKRWNLDKGSRILDICCGAGTYFPTIQQEKFNNLVGLDFSANLLSQVETSVELIQADALLLPFKENSFDIVIIHKALHHFHDYTPLVTEIQNILRPGGNFCFIEPRKTWFRNLYHSFLLSPVTKLSPLLTKYKEAALDAEGETYFQWLDKSPHFFNTLEDTFNFKIESLKKDLLHYVVKCKSAH